MKVCKENNQSSPLTLQKANQGRWVKGGLLDLIWERLSCAVSIRGVWGLRAPSTLSTEVLKQRPDPLQNWTGHQGPAQAPPRPRPYTITTRGSTWPQKPKATVVWGLPHLDRENRRSCVAFLPGQGFWVRHIQHCCFNDPGLKGFHQGVLTN